MKCKCAAQNGDASASEITSGGVDGSHYLQIDFALTVEPDGDSCKDTISTPSDDLFAGTWITDYWIEFDFWSDDVVPNALEVRWGADGA